MQKYSNEVIDRKIPIMKLTFLSKIFNPKVVGKFISIMTGQPTELIIPLIYGVKNDAVVNTPHK